MVIGTWAWEWIVCLSRGHTFGRFWSNWNCFG